MWLILAACLAALLIGLVIVALAGWSTWRSGRRLLRTAGTLMDRAAQASDQLSTLSGGLGSNPTSPVRRTM